MQWKKGSTQIVVVYNLSSFKQIIIKFWELIAFIKTNLSKETKRDSPRGGKDTLLLLLKDNNVKKQKQK